MRKRENKNPIVLTDMLEIFDRVMRRHSSKEVQWVRSLREQPCTVCSAPTLFDKCTLCQSAESENTNV